MLRSPRNKKNARLAEVVRHELARRMWKDHPEAATTVLSATASSVRPSAQLLYGHLEQLAGNFPSREPEGDPLDRIRMYLCRTAELLLDRFDPETTAMLLVVDRYYREPINKQTIADAVHCAPQTVVQRFSRDLGMTICPYVRRLRITEALCYLSSMDNIPWLASHLGWVPSGFVVAFRREIVICTPKQYRMIFSQEGEPKTQPLPYSSPSASISVAD
ncbi:MAG TPA: AraC family transcriptional regulator [Candidatus Nanoarchaeia archaeon]|nr:AraC family transcriptional regulator [Candidatus Nanoarchaeia archaeon]